MKTPGTVKAAAVCWAVAIAAGVTETGLVVTELAMDDAFDAGVWTAIGLRSIVYTVAAALVVFFTLGRRWARTALTALLSVVGLAAMVVPAAMELASGADFADAFGSGGELADPFLAVRLLHIAAVVVATAAMFTPGANAYFAGRRELQRS
ncbi:hypothetical protein [Glycomyces salinus]|uniref:hypothetical protein n=1 Tax=Glycomyces salinus TaxID=980294 RepID=UPI0018EAE305|nr:hypothetical protein [Glycomyces salinus]